MCAQDHFSWADVLEERIDPRWSELKEQGNEALRADSLTTAINFYEAALSVTQQPLPQLRALEAVGARHPTSALARFATTEGVGGAPLMLDLLPQYLPMPLLRNNKQQLAPNVELNSTYPNRPAAICMANIAAARMKRLASGDLEQALKDATEASELCPEYVKAHSRVAAILVRLAKAPDLSEADRSELLERAKRKKREVAGFEKLTAMLPWNGPALEQVGWIDPWQYQLLYEDARFEALMTRLRATNWRTAHAPGGEFFGKAEEALAPCFGDNRLAVHAAISLVAKDGGQFAMLNLSYFDAAQAKKGKIDGLRYVGVAHDGAELLEEPPHGRGTDAALRRTIVYASGWLDELQGDFGTLQRNGKPRYGFKVVSLMLGQGLVCHKEAFEAALRENMDKAGLECPMVHAALTSMCSENHYGF